MGRILLDGEQRRDWLRLISSENVGPVTFRQLINRFGSAGEALKALPDLAKRGGLQRPIRIYPKADAEQDIERVEALDARLVA
jgi:DNA processing protein